MLKLIRSNLSNNAVLISNNSCLDRRLHRNQRQFYNPIDNIWSLLYLFLKAVLNNNIKLLVRPRLNQCAKDLGVNQEELNKVINNDLSNTSTPLQVR